jgi:hypothetical protein
VYMLKGVYHLHLPVDGLVESLVMRNMESNQRHRPLL